MVAGYRAGQSVNVLADKFGITRQRVSLILQRHDVARRYRLLNDERLAQARQIYDQGNSLEQVGERLGVSAKTVQAAFRKAGFTTRPVGTNRWR
jgi:DNA-binding transcriptional regulator LsrR (DeoR family)